MKTVILALSILIMFSCTIQPRYLSTREQSIEEIKEKVLLRNYVRVKYKNNGELQSRIFTINYKSNMGLGGSPSSVIPWDSIISITKLKKPKSGLMDSLGNAALVSTAL